MIAFRKAIQDKLVYPQNMRERYIEGKVVLQFIVTDKGDIEYIKILRDIGHGSGEVATRALMGARIKQRWIPAKNAQGQPVSVRKTIIVRFKL
jgi:protein TonB